MFKVGEFVHWQGNGPYDSTIGRVFETRPSSSHSYHVEWLSGPWSGMVFWESADFLALVPGSTAALLILGQLKM